MSSERLAIRLENVSKRYEIYAAPRDRLKQMLLPPVIRAAHEMGRRLGLARTRRPDPRYFAEFWALKEVSLEVRPGETLGIIGRNGSGKSTLLQIVAGTLAPTSGTVETAGRIAALLELGSGFNPEFTGRENIFLNSAILGMSRAETERRLDDILAFADIGDFVDQPVKTYSSGMFVRLAFAVQAHIDASVVLIDEALAVGDVFFRQKCYKRLEELRASGAAIVLVSHAMPDVEQFCEHAILLDHGKVLFRGRAAEATKHYYLLHQGEVLGLTASQPAAIVPASAQPGSDDAPAWRPSAAAFLNIANMPQVSNGCARCIGVALSDVNGDPCTAFRQGDIAIFHYEFEILGPIGVAVAGIVIRNDKGVIVHGKNSWQIEDAEGAVPTPGTVLLVSQEVVLDLAPAEYVFEVGLASVTEADWRNRARIPHAEMATRHARICHVPDVGTFSVSFALRDGVPVLTHHGVADLRGGMKVQVVPGQSESVREVQLAGSSR